MLEWTQPTLNRDIPRFKNIVLYMLKVSMNVVFLLQEVRSNPDMPDSNPEADRGTMIGAP
jgi:hypothetical protein